MELLADHEILVGTYEEFLLGYKPLKSGDLAPSFTDHGHSSSIKSLAAAGKFLVSGAADEQVKIYNLRNRKEHGNLHHHDGTINTLVFYDEKHLVSAAEDGKICILKTKGWAVEKTLLKHTAGVTDVSIHPSGKLALSVGRDRKLITWNLIKGRSAYVSNIYEVADFVRWSPEGGFYAVGFYKRVDVYALDGAAVVFTIKLAGRSNAVAFLDEDTVAVAGEMPDIEIYSVSQKKLLHKFEAHETRVRCLHLEKSPLKANHFALVTASNDGFIRVWQIVRTKDQFEVTQSMSYDTKCRITCMAVHWVPPVKKTAEDTSAVVVAKKKKKRKIGEEKKSVTVGAAAGPEGVSSRAKKPKLIVEVEIDNATKEEPKKKKKMTKKKKSIPVSGS